MRFEILALFILAVSFNAFAQVDDTPAIKNVEQMATPSSPRMLKGSFGFGFSNAHSLEFSDSNLVGKSGRQYPGTSEFGIKPSYMIQVGFQQVPVRGLGFSGFIDYESRIGVENFSESYMSQKSKGDFATKPQLSLLTFSGNGVYGLERMYIPFGINVTIAEYQTNSSSSASAEPALGFQLGVGMYALENLAIDLTFKRRSFSLNEQFSTGGGRVFGAGNIDALHLQARVLF